MAETETESVGTRFPFINLEKALGRAEELYKADPKGREMPIAAAFSVWGYSDKSSGGFQTIAALRMYGLTKRTDAGKVSLSEDALRYFRDEREDVKRQLLSGFVLHPPLIFALWKDWKTNPPADAIARSHLKTDRELSDQAARTLLALYKENLVFAKFTGDTMVPAVEEEVDEAAAHTVTPHNRFVRRAPPPFSPPPPAGKGKLMDDERELTAGLLSKEASFRLIVSGPIGVKEIERLIAKLEIDKEILTEPNEKTPS